MKKLFLCLAALGMTLSANAWDFPQITPVPNSVVDLKHLNEVYLKIGQMRYGDIEVASSESIILLTGPNGFCKPLSPSFVDDTDVEFDLGLSEEATPGVYTMRIPANYFTAEDNWNDGVEYNSEQIISWTLLEAGPEQPAGTWVFETSYPHADTEADAEYLADVTIEPGTRYEELECVMSGAFLAVWGPNGYFKKFSPSYVDEGEFDLDLGLSGATLGKYTLYIPANSFRAQHVSTPGGGGPIEYNREQTISWTLVGSINSSAVNGTIETSRDYSRAGETITITVTPNPNTVLTSITANNGAITLTEIAENQYTFTMPNAHVSISAICSEILTAHEDPQDLGKYYVTYYNDQADCEVDENTTIYMTQLNQGYLCFATYEQDFIPYRTPVVLMTQDASHKITVTPKATKTSDAFFDDNVLLGVNQTTPVTNITTSGTIYTLAAEDNEMAFYKFVGTEIPAHKAYLLLSAGTPAPHRIAFGTHTATGVENTIADVQAEKILLDGQLFILKNGNLYNVQGALVK